MKNYKEYKDFDLAKINSKMLSIWEKESLFESSIKSRPKSKPFVFYEGPPSANGMPGIHHVMGRTIKDLFCRYKTLCGFRVERRAGWDAHGLPVELSVEKELGITKEDINKTISISEYNAHCKKTVMRYTSSWNELTKKMGYWVDMKNPYITYNTKYIESVWFLLKRLFNKNLVYKGFAIQPYSPSAGTGLSSHELNLPGCYKNVKDTSVFALFKIVTNLDLFVNCSEGVFFLAWTTTPWTLPANTALAVNEKIVYSLIKTFNPYTEKVINIICASDLVGVVLKNSYPVSDFKGAFFDKKKIPYCILKTFLGKELLGIKYEQLLKYCEPYQNKKNAFVVLGADFVTTEGGTGVVHMAPTFGADDKLVAEKNNVPGMLVLDKQNNPVPIVNTKGQYIDCMGEFSGRFVKKEYAESEAESLDVDIAIKLKKSGLVFRIEKYEHSYPHCWRTDKPILYYPLNSWFIKTSSQKKTMLKNNQQVFWQPRSTGDGRFKNWLEGLNDWNLSRSRFWGTPIPIWCSEDEKEVLCIGSIEDLFYECEKSVNCGFMKKNPLCKFIVGDMSDKNYNKIDLHKHIVDDIVLCSDSGQKMFRELDLMDVWFDSGAMPFAQIHYPFENKKKFDLGEVFPADFIAEGVDQTRGWFFTLHAISSMCFDSVAFKSVISNGLVLDSSGQKMSKRLGNAINPFSLIEKFGSDPVRWYMITNANPWENIKFNVSGVDEVKRKFFGTLFNTYSFFALYANIDGFLFSEPRVPFSKRPLLDRWVVSELNLLIKSVTKAYDSFDATKSGRLIQSFLINDLSNWYVRLCRRRFWKNDYGPEKISAFQTLHECLVVVSQLMCPIAPFYSDLLYRDLFFKNKKSSKSVHLSRFPVFKKDDVDVGLKTKMNLVQSIVSLGLSLRKKLNIRVRQPLSGVSIIKNKHSEFALNEDLLGLIKLELNVKNVSFVSASSSFVEKKLTPNFSVLGKKHKNLMKDISIVVSKLSSEQVFGFEKNKKLPITVIGKKIILFEEDLVVKAVPVDGWSVANNDIVTVALETTLSDDLINEGVSREFVNRVQGLRKTSGFSVVDWVDLVVFCDEFLGEGIKKNKDYVSSEVLAKSLVFEKIKPNNCNVVEINGSKVYIAIKLHPKND